MSDRLQCPDCGGTGQQAIGPLRMACTFCQGLGYVGDDNEPAEEREAPPGPVRPVWETAAVQTLAVCRVCFGARKVMNLSDSSGELTGKLVEMPCPACTARDGEASE